MLTKDQNRTPLLDAVIAYGADDIVPMHIPSHKMGQAINPRLKEFAGENIFKMDITEVHGLDDLHQPESIIKDAQELAADAWGADKSFFLVNGTSAGIIASITTVAGEGEKIIIPRNAHKSVVFALIISGAQPVYVSAEISKQLGLVCGFNPKTVENAFAAHPESKGIFMVSPTYYGVCSDLAAIIDIAHQHDAIAIADEAHGNHVYFHPSLPAGALTVGADISCQSTHKMSGSLTQSSMLHVKGNRVDLGRLRFNLQMMQSTSPSYILQASLDAARSHIATKGTEILGELIDMSQKTRKTLSEIPGIEVLGPEIIGDYSIVDYDPIRIVISARKLGIEGYELYDMLRQDYKIEAEFGDYFYVICVLGLGTSQQHINRLIIAVRDISNRYLGLKNALQWNEELPPLPPQIMTPRQAYFAQAEIIPWAQARGRICAEMIVPYPPGIPTICPGEIVTEDVWAFLDRQNRNNRHLHGPENGKLDKLSVVK